MIHCLECETSGANCPAHRVPDKTPRQIELEALQAELERAQTNRTIATEAHTAATRQIKELQEQINRISRPQMPPTRRVENGGRVDLHPVIRFSKKFPNSFTLYTFAAIGFQDSWYVTQSRPSSNPYGHGSGDMSWERLLEWIGPKYWDTIEFLG